MNSKGIAIIGAGITGLTAAFRLKKTGKAVDLFERKGEPGGAIKSHQQEDWLYEFGPNTLLLKDKAVQDFLWELGLKDKIVTANPEASKRFIVKNGALVPVPMSILEFIKTPLFSSKAKWRLLLEPFAGESNDNQPSLSEFVNRRFGREILDYAVNPFVAGVYAGKPENLSFKHAFPILHELENETGSIYLSAIKRYLFKKTNEEKISRSLISLEGGLQQIPVAITKQLDQCYFNHDVSSVNKKEDGWYINSQMGTYGPYKKVIFTAPLYKWNSTILPITELEEETIKSVNYPPLSVMTLGFKNEDIDHPLDGFGFLVPEKENRNILGALVPSTIFKNRAPADHHLLTVFIGGGRQPELADLDSEKLLKMVTSELTELIGLHGDPVFKEHIFWPKSIPQYEPGYDQVLDVFDQIEKRNPGLHLAGNFRNGISVPDCIKNGLKLADDLS
ncbi:MAG: protoporphyrinogen oxidase [Balneolaceae bacterium]